MTSDEASYLMGLLRNGGGVMPEYLPGLQEVVDAYLAIPEALRNQIAQVAWVDSLIRAGQRLAHELEIEANCPGNFLPEADAALKDWKTALGGVA